LWRPLALWALVSWVWYQSWWIFSYFFHISTEGKNKKIKKNRCKITKTSQVSRYEFKSTNKGKTKCLIRWINNRSRQTNKLCTLKPLSCVLKM
jgi:hypothetical protein